MNAVYQYNFCSWSMAKFDYLENLTQKLHFQNIVRCKYVSRLKMEKSL